MVTKASAVVVRGPLAGHVDGFRVWLLGRGYTLLSAANQLRVMAHVSRWLVEQGLRVEDLTVERVGVFLEARRAAGYTCWLSPRGVAPLVGYLRCQGVMPEPAPESPTGLEVLLAEYRSYLVGERGLVAATVGNHERVAREFLVVVGDDRLGELTAAEVVGFVMAECPRRSVGAAKIVVTGLRSLLRFLYVTGRVGAPLASAVPAVAGWRGGGVAGCPERCRRVMCGV